MSEDWAVKQLDNEDFMIVKNNSKTRGFELVKKKFLKSYNECREVLLPLRGTKTSAGYDFFLPKEVEILPEAWVLVWTDVKAYMQEDEVLEIYPRSSIAIKKEIRIKNIVGIIDSDYYNNIKNDGNIGLCLWNFGSRTVYIKAGEAIAQGIFKKFLVSENCNSDKERVGGLGSTSE